MMHDVPVYVQIGRRHRGYYTRPVMLRATQKRPEAVEAGAVVVKMVVRIPDEAFLPLAPEAVIDIPLDLVQRPVEVTAVEP